MRFILSIIAVCLVLITAKLYIPEANADVDGMTYSQLYRDYHFKRAVEQIIEDETSEKFEEISDVFLRVGNSMKLMIVEQCSVQGRRISCPIDYSLTIQN